MQIHTVLHTPLTYPISQRVLMIFHSFLMQIISIFIPDSFPIKFLARAHFRARYAPEYSENSKKKTLKKDENWNFLRFQIHLQRLQIKAHNQNIFVNSNSLDKIDAPKANKKYQKLLIKIAFQQTTLPSISNINCWEMCHNQVWIKSQIN